MYDYSTQSSGPIFIQCYPRLMQLGYFLMLNLNKWLLIEWNCLCSHVICMPSVLENQNYRTLFIFCWNKLSVQHLALPTTHSFHAISNHKLLITFNHLLYEKELLLATRLEHYTVLLKPKGKTLHAVGFEIHGQHNSFFQFLWLEHDGKILPCAREGRHQDIFH